MRTAIIAAAVMFAVSACSSRTIPAEHDAGRQQADAAAQKADAAADALAEAFPDVEQNASIPEPIDARHQVRFVVENDGSHPRLVVVDGFNCTPFAIDRLTGDGWESVGLELVAGMWGNCAGNDYEEPRAHHLVWLAAGDSYTLPWDGRGVVTHEGETNCFGDPGVYGVKQPLPAGTYRVSVLLESSPPEPSCADDGVMVDCSLGGFTTKLPVPLEACPHGSVARAEFTLPDSGLLDVTVRLVQDDCPIVDGACATGCAPSKGVRFDQAKGCYEGPLELLLCHDEYDTYPAQSLPMEAPDGTCWLVNAVVQKFYDEGWSDAFDAGSACDGHVMLGAPACS